MRFLPSSILTLPRVLVGSLLLSVAAVGMADARLVVPPRAPSVRASGVTFSSRVTSSSADKKVRETSSSLSTVRMQDGNIRMDYIEGVTPMGQKNGYVIVQGEAGRFVIVNPKDKQAFVMSADGFGSGLGALMNNPIMKVTMTNTSFHFKELGAGEPILGYKTRWGAAALAGFIVAATWVFHTAPDQRIQLLKNLAILGGLLNLIAQGPGDISLEGAGRKS